MTDLFRILSVAKGQPADKPPPHPSDDVDELLSHPTSTTPSKIPPSYPVEMHTRILTGDFTEPVPFWDTPLGRSIGHTSTVTWAVGASKVQPATEKEGGWVADYPSAGNAADGVDAVGDALTTTTTGNESAAIEADNGSSGSTHGDGLCVKRSSNPNCNEIGFACASRKPSHQEPHNGDETSLPIQTSVGVTETSWKNTESRHDTRNLDKAPPTLECWLDPAEQEGTMESAAGHSQQQSPTTRHGCGDRVDVLDGVRRESVAGNVAGTPAQGTGAQAVRRLVKGPSARESLGWTHGGRGHELGGKESSGKDLQHGTLAVHSGWEIGNCSLQVITVLLLSIFPIFFHFSAFRFSSIFEISETNKPNFCRRRSFPVFQNLAIFTTRPRVVIGPALIKNKGEKNAKTRQSL